MKSPMLVLAASLVLSVPAAETIKPDRAWMWRRSGNSSEAPFDGKSIEVRHSDAGDWSLGCFPRLAVRTGDRFELVFDTEALSDRRGKVIPCVVTHGADEKVLSWMFASADVEVGSRGRIEFVVPNGVAFITPRFVGEGETDARISGIELRKLPNLLGENPPKSPMTIDGGELSVTISNVDGTLTVRDHVTGREWTCAAGEGQSDCLVSQLSVLRDGGTGAQAEIVNTRDLSHYRVTYRVAGLELSVAVEGLDGEMKAALDYPAAFATRKGDRLIAPMNEGMGFPVDERHPGLWHEGLYSGHGLCMAFFGVAEDATGAGWMTIVETPDDAAMKTRYDPSGNLAASVSWEPCYGKPGYVRKSRYVFFPRGGHVAMAKRYRDYMRKKGNVVTFAEKAKKRPRVLDLLGAPNIWCWGSDEKLNLSILEEIRAAGARRVLWSAGGSPDFVRRLAAMDGVLVGRYDIYQDIMDPKRRNELSWWHPDWVTEAFPHDIMWSGPSPDRWTHGWPVDAKHGPRIDCAVLCDRQALPYARRRIGAEQQEKPYNTRFIDTTTASPWRECWNPAHPMTRGESREWKMKLLNVVSGEFGLVCGSETGHDAAVPYCDYFEGMLSIGPYRIDEAGRDMWRTIDEVPERVAKYQVGEKYRLPLWELVYHDCTVAQWYWGDYNNKLPATWRRRDLFNALYGTPPMYLFHAHEWKKWRERVLASVPTAIAAAKAAAGTEMVDHEFLKPDRSVQRTRFANGVEVTVDFDALTCRIRNENGEESVPGF